VSANRTHVVRVALVALCAAGAWWLTHSSHDSHESHETNAKNEKYVTPPHPAAAALANYAKPDTTPRDDLRAVASVLDTFRLLAKGDALPLGSNEEISAALRGETRAKLALLPRDHPAFDAKGRIVDRWGTPLFFHAQSAKDIEVRSAGPDREMGTADDVVFGDR
jgi:hypothetical protein